MFQKYRSANIMFSSAYKLYDQTIPAYLKDRPYGIIKHCMKRVSAGKSDFSERDIKKRELFEVQSASSRYTTKNGIYRESISLPYSSVSWILLGTFTIILSQLSVYEL